jgi:hypothetical protein
MGRHDEATCEEGHKRKRGEQDSESANEKEKGNRCTCGIVGLMYL